MNPYNGDPYIETFTGKKFRPQEPNWEDIDIVDIAHSLSQKCRYTGHTRAFYSIAQHSVLVSELVDEQYALEGLLHDAAEAYFPDIPYPLRPVIKELEIYENALHRCVSKRFGLKYPFPQSVHDVDKNITQDEAYNLMHSRGLNWPGNRKRFGVTIECYYPKEAEKVFLLRYSDILLTRDVPDPWHFKALTYQRLKDKDHDR